MVHLNDLPGFGDLAQRRALFAVDHFVTTPVTPEVQRAIHEWARAHNDTLAQALAPHGLTPSDILVPTYERIVYRDEIDPIL